MRYDAHEAHEIRYEHRKGTKVQHKTLLRYKSYGLEMVITISRQADFSGIAASLPQSLIYPQQKEFVFIKLDHFLPPTRSRKILHCGEVYT